MENLQMIFEIVMGVGAVLFFTTAGIFIGRNFYSWNSFLLTAIYSFYIKHIELGEDKNKTKFNQLNSIRKFHIEQADLMMNKIAQLKYSESKSQ